MIDLREFERLKGNILSLNYGGIIKSIMVSSSVRKEGCSIVASNLAITLAKNETMKVGLIDGNLRHPSLHESFDLENNMGLSDLILGRADIKDVCKQTKIPNLSIIPCGGGEIDPNEVFDPQKLKTIIARLRDEFNYLIFDSAPVNAYSDTPILASQVDGVVLVVYAGNTRWEVAQKAKEQLEIVHARILGVVLNRRRYVIPGFLYKRL